MNRHVYRLTYQPQCGKTNVVVETGDCIDEAWGKAKQHIENKHTPMKLVKVECRWHGNYNWERCR